MLGAPSTDAFAWDPTAFLAYARRGRNAWWLYLLALIAAVILAAAITAGGSVVLYQMGRFPADFAQELQHPRHPVAFFSYVGLNFAILLIAFLAAVALLQGKSPRDLMGVWRWRNFAAGALLWLGVVAVGAAVEFALRPAGFRFSATSATLTMAAIAFPALLVQTLFEEIVFRGWLAQGFLLWTRRPLVTALLTGLLFGALHIFNSIPSAIGATMLGFVTCAIAIRTGGVAFTWGLHLVNNLFGALIVVSSSDVFSGAPGLFTLSGGVGVFDIAEELLGLALVAALVLWSGFTAPPPAAPPPDVPPGLPR